VSEDVETSRAHKADTDVELTGVRTRDVRSEIAMAAAVIAVGVAFIVLALDIRQGSIPDPITARGLPIIVGASMIVLGLVPLARATLGALRPPRQRTVDSEGSDDEPGFPSTAWRVMCFALGALAWVRLVDVVGHFVATPVALAAALISLGMRQWLMITAIAVSFTLIAWLLFATALGIPLPLGILEEFFRDLGWIT
jgi:putative tricarboxylic transport membrane protein